MCHADPRYGPRRAEIENEGRVVVKGKSNVTATRTALTRTEADYPGGLRGYRPDLTAP